MRIVWLGWRRGDGELRVVKLGRRRSDRDLRVAELGRGRSDRELRIARLGRRRGDGELRIVRLGSRRGDGRWERNDKRLDTSNGRRSVFFNGRMRKLVNAQVPLSSVRLVALVAFELSTTGDWSILVFVFIRGRGDGRLVVTVVVTLFVSSVGGMVRKLCIASWPRADVLLSVSALVGDG